MKIMDVDNKIIKGGLFATAILLFALFGVMLSTHKVCWADQSTQSTYYETYEDDKAKAEVFSDGVSGCIKFKANENYYLNNIGGKPLKEIMRLEDGGFIEEFCVTFCPLGLFFPSISTFHVNVTTDGTTPYWLTFMEDDGETYNLTIFNSWHEFHTVRAFSYNRAEKHVKQITWQPIF